MTNVPFNQKKFVSPVNEIGTLASLNQTMVVGQGNERQQVDASFNAKKNQTIIKVQRSQEEKDHDHEHANEDPKPIIKPDWIYYGCSRVLAIALSIATGYFLTYFFSAIPPVSDPYTLPFASATTPSCDPSGSGSGMDAVTFPSLALPIVMPLRNPGLVFASD